MTVQVTRNEGNLPAGYRPGTTGTDVEENEQDFTSLTLVGAPPGVTQMCRVHEYGHALGLHHPGQDLTPPAAPGSVPDYTADATALMGVGMQMRWFYYQKWADQLAAKYSDCRPFFIR